MYYEIPVVFVINSDTEQNAADKIIQLLVDRAYYNPGSGPQAPGDEPWPTVNGSPVVDTWYLPNHYPDAGDNYQSRLVWERYTGDADIDFYVKAIEVVWPAGKSLPSNDELIEFIGDYLSRPNGGWVKDFTLAFEHLREALHDAFSEFREYEE